MPSNGLKKNIRRFYLFELNSVIHIYVNDNWKSFISDEFEDIEDAATSASQSAAYALAENSPLG